MFLAQIASLARAGEPTQMFPAGALVGGKGQRAEALAPWDLQITPALSPAQEHSEGWSWRDGRSRRGQRFSQLSSWNHSSVSNELLLLSVLNSILLLEGSLRDHTDHLCSYTSYKFWTSMRSNVCYMVLGGALWSIWECGEAQWAKPLSQTDVVGAGLRNVDCPFESDILYRQTVLREDVIPSPQLI